MKSKSLLLAPKWWLTCFDPKQETEPVTDTSPSGLFAWVVAYANWSLTDIIANKYRQTILSLKEKH